VVAGDPAGALWRWPVTRHAGRPEAARAGRRHSPSAGCTGWVRRGGRSPVMPWARRRPGDPELRADQVPRRALGYSWRWPSTTADSPAAALPRTAGRRGPRGGLGHRRRLRRCHRRRGCPGRRAAWSGPLRGRCLWLRRACRPRYAPVAAAGPGRRRCVPAPRQQHRGRRHYHRQPRQL